jgi:hypothetical protein
MSETKFHTHTESQAKGNIITCLKESGPGNEKQILMDSDRDPVDGVCEYGNMSSSSTISR